MRRFTSVLLAGMFLSGCATAFSEDRKAYILAHPHGWVEVTVSDLKIPDVPQDEESKDIWVRPYSCGVSVSINEEPILRDAAYPSGEVAPYAVSTGFRFPAPVGGAELEFSYSRCRIEDDEIVSIELTASFPIEEGDIHEIVFDGISLEIQEPRPNDVVTLEDVYEELTGRRSPDS